jgi:glutaconate CoA-transferase, subunit B
MAISDISDRIVVAAAEAWRGNGEILATGIGVIPRLAVGLAKLTHSPELMLTDGEAYLVEAPSQIGKGAGDSGASGWMPYGRVFELVWSGNRHAMVTPTQIDRWGQANISCLGDYRRPKVQMLGVRGFPGNSVCHINSMFVPGHDRRVFVANQVDMVASAGYRPGAFSSGMRQDLVDLRLIVTNLCVMDFGGPDRALRVTGLVPGVAFKEVQEATGFELHRVADLGEMPPATTEQQEIVAKLDPENLRSRILKPRNG